MLSDAYAVSEDTVIAEVDCAREEMKSLCDRFQVNAYPSLKYAQAGYEGELVDYEGEMTFEALEAFAKANVRAGCTAKQRDACDAEQLALLDKVRRNPATRERRMCARMWIHEMDSVCVSGAGDER